jgi:hypothetical protein
MDKWRSSNGCTEEASGKEPPEGNGGAWRAFTVVREEIHAKIDVFGEKLEAVEASLRGEIGEVRAEMRAGFRDVDRRFDRVEGELAHVKSDVALVKIAVLENTREVKDLRRAVEDLDARKVDRSELASLVR